MRKFDLLLFCLTIAMAFLWHSNNAALIRQERELSVCQAQLAELERSVAIANATIAMRTDPEFVDLSLRAWFDEQLKQAPAQVRGADGKYPRER